LTPGTANEYSVRLLVFKVLMDERVDWGKMLRIFRLCNPMKQGFKQAARTTIATQLIVSPGVNFDVAD
jgi:hypothetical protein